MRDHLSAGWFCRLFHGWWRIRVIHERWFDGNAITYRWYCSRCVRYGGVSRIVPRNA